MRSYHGVEAGRLTAVEAKRSLRELDGDGFHVAGKSRERADELIDEAAAERADENCGVETARSRSPMIL